MLASARANSSEVLFTIFLADRATDLLSITPKMSITTPISSVSWTKINIAAAVLVFSIGK